MEILSYGDIALPPTKYDSFILDHHFNRINRYLADFLELPGKNLALYCTENRLSFSVYQWLCEQIGGGNYNEQ